MVVDMDFSMLTLKAAALLFFWIKLHFCSLSSSMLSGNSLFAEWHWVLCCQDMVKAQVDLLELHTLLLREHLVT